MQQQMCNNALMPSTDENAKAFDETRARWFGFAVGTRRKALKITAIEVARRTAELGYPISRGAIAKIESNVRSGKIDVAEVLVLAAALDVPPVLLLFPQLSLDGGSPVLPSVLTSDDEAVRWMSGGVSFPQEYDLSTKRLKGQPNPPNDGVNLIAAVALLEKALETRISLVDYWHKVKEDAADAETAQRMLEKNNEQIEAAKKRVRDAREALWGFRDNYDPPEPECDD
jgi:transcriptional regulator with XRE-family HTH domain